MSDKIQPLVAFPPTFTPTPMSPEERALHQRAMLALFHPIERWPVRFTVPIKSPSAPNQRLHWAAKAKQTAKQKLAARASCPVWSMGPLLVVRLTRVAPRELDGDNLQGALKAVRDGVALWLRVDDASPLVEWKYAQAKGEPRVEVEVDAL